MKKIYISLLTGVILLCGVAGAAGQAQASSYCRTYTKSISLNGFSSVGYAQACKTGYGTWQVTNMSGPVETYARLQDMIYQDIRHIDPGAIVVNNAYYNAVPSARSRVIYREVPVYYGKNRYYDNRYYHGKNNNHHHNHGRGNDHNRHDRHDRHDNRDRHSNGHPSWR